MADPTLDITPFDSGDEDAGLADGNPHVHVHGPGCSHGASTDGTSGAGLGTSGAGNIVTPTDTPEQAAALVRLQEILAAAAAAKAADAGSDTDDADDADDDGDDASAAASHPCGFCGKAAATKKCSKCMQAYYCARDCQVKAWKTHKKSCGRRVESQPGEGARRPHATLDPLGFGAPEKDVSAEHRLTPRWIAICRAMDLDPAVASRRDVAKQAAASAGSPLERYAMPTEGSTVVIVTPGHEYEGKTFTVIATNAEAKEATLLFSDGRLCGDGKEATQENLTALALISNPDPGDGLGGTHPTAYVQGDEGGGEKER